MKNNIVLPANINIKPFLDCFSKQLNGLFNKKIHTSLATLLAVDYSVRLNSEPDLKNYINDCSAKIKKQASKIKLDEESFSTIMTLFSIAISPETTVESDSNEPLKKSQDALINAVIAANFSDLTPQELSHIRLIMKDILQASEGKEMMEIITSNPKLFYSIVVSTYRKNKKQKELLRLIHIRLINIAFQKKVSIDKKPLIDDKTPEKTLEKFNEKKFVEKEQTTSSTDITLKTKKFSQKELHEKEKELAKGFIKSKPQKSLLEKIKEEKTTKKSNEKSRSI